MDALGAGFVERLRTGKADPAPLARSGEAEPARAAQAFEQAMLEPALAATCARWAPVLLGAARPGFGAERLLELVRARRACGGPDLAPETLVAAARVVGASNFLARLLVQQAEWAEELAQPGLPPPPPPHWEEIRSFKYRGLLRVAARELGGAAFEQSLADLSGLADQCLAAALACSAAESRVDPPALFALGKLGGRELNLSSDVDLLVIYEAGDGPSGLERNDQVARLVRLLKRRLEEPSADGFVYRVDLDLRPEGPTGALANSVPAALDYYESFGAEWERQMLIRLRCVAGPDPVAHAFAEGVVPFVYRRAIAVDSLAHVRAMKTRIEEERRAQRRDLEADLKEGPGGIRDVEFLVQALQLFYGGRHPELRTGNVLEALAGLAGLGILPEETARALSDAYRWLRRAEHGVQLVEERQVHAFPRDAAEQRALARRMGYRDPEGEQARARLLEDWVAVRSEVRGHFEALVLGA